jgi:transposase
VPGRCDSAINFRGDAYLHTRLIQAAWAKAVATEKATPEQLWIRSLDARLPFGKVIVAIANKHARQIWAMLAREVDYDPHACLNHPPAHAV